MAASLTRDKDLLLLLAKFSFVHLSVGISILPNPPPERAQLAGILAWSIFSENNGPNFFTKTISIYHENPSLTTFACL